MRPCRLVLLSPPLQCISLHLILIILPRFCLLMLCNQCSAMSTTLHLLQIFSSHNVIDHLSFIMHPCHLVLLSPPLQCISLHLILIILPPFCLLMLCNQCSAMSTTLHLIQIFSFHNVFLPALFYNAPISPEPYCPHLLKWLSSSIH